MNESLFKTIKHPNISVTLLLVDSTLCNEESLKENIFISERYRPLKNKMSNDDGLDGEIHDCVFCDKILFGAAVIATHMAEEHPPQMKVQYSYIYDMLRSGILGSSENTKTNEVNMHGFCTDTFLNCLKVGLRIYLCKQKCIHSIGRTLVEHVFFA